MDLIKPTVKYDRGKIVIYFAAGWREPIIFYDEAEVAQLVLDLDDARRRAWGPKK